MYLCVCVCVCTCICTFRYKTSEKIYRKYCLPIGFSVLHFFYFLNHGYQFKNLKINQNQFTKDQSNSSCMYCMLTMY